MFENKLIKLTCICTVFLLVGCAQLNLPFRGKPAQPTEISPSTDRDELPSLESNEFVNKGRIVNAQYLKSDRTIAFYPFKAGKGAEATDELDKVALEIIKGVDEAFKDAQNSNDASLNILTAQDSQDADLIIRGHITEMGAPSKLRRWVLMKNKKTINVEGKITDVRSGDIVLIFSDQAAGGSKNDGYRQLGRMIGKNIGRYILSGVE